jgi:hypothetical protein
VTPVTKDQIATVALSLRVDGKPSFMLLLTRDGDVKRMGTSAVDGVENVVATGRPPDVFDAFLAELDEGLLSLTDAYEDVDGPGPRCHWRIELGGGAAPIRFELHFDGERTGLPGGLAALVASAERLTDEWYAEQVEAQTGARPALASHGGHTDPGIVVGSPASELYALAPAAPPDAPPPSRPPQAAEPEAPAAASASESTPRGTGRPAAPHPYTSKKRIAFVVLLDFVVIGIPATLLAAPFGIDAPLGAILMLFALLEVVLLQIVRRSPGTWLLGMAKALGEEPRVDPAFLSRESLLTHIVGWLFLGVGAEGLTAWTAYHTPFPYFGLPLGTVLSVIFTVLLSGAYVAAGALILRTDVRGVWIGVGATAFALLSEWPARGADLDAWAAAEVANRRAWTGTQPFSGEVESFQAMVFPILLGATVLFAVGLYFVWRRFEGKKQAPAERAAPKR